jgi:hypothetical protein
MKKAMKSLICFIILANFFLLPIRSQEKQDSTKNYKNTIRINLSNPALFGLRNIILGYERTFKNNQSITLNLGKISFPTFASTYSDSISLDVDYKEKGFCIAMDYRFYLKKENKYAAPHGVYIGPYYSYNYFNRTNNWYLNANDFAGTLSSDLKLNMNLLGVQLGYQFIFWNRFSVDMVLFGPGRWFYKINTSLSTDLSVENEELIFSKINEILDAKLPGNNLNISPGKLNKNGSGNTNSSGFRYVVHFGFRF